MKNILLFALNFFIINSTFAQKKLIKKIFSNDKDTVRKASFMPIPVFGYSQEIGFEFGAGSIYSLYLDKKDTTTRSSNFYTVASYSTKKTYNFALKGDAWTRNNALHFIGDIKFRNMPFNFYGIGNSTSGADEDRLVQRTVRLNFDAEKNTLKNAYTGISLGYENHKLTDKETGGIFSNSANIVDKDGGQVLFAGVSQSYDTRNSNNYPTKGFFGRISYQYALPLFGKDSFKGSQIKVNVRNFWSLAPKVVLGAQGLFYTLQSNSQSFYLMPQLGNDEMMRGYYSGRYRDQNLSAAQLEIRYRFMERLGIVAFGGVGKVFSNQHLNLKDFKPNYGIGGRLFFDPEKGLSIRLDYGIGEKRMNEKRQSGMYISLAESF
jgi:outer membrane protein assembly factor BamA